MSVLDKKLYIESISDYPTLLRGYYDFQDGNIIKIVDENNCFIHALIKGDKKEVYHVTLSKKNILDSTCDCSLCKDNAKRICQHKVALYFYIHNDEYEILKNKIEYKNKLRKQYYKLKDKEYLDELENVKNRVEEQLKHLSKDEKEKYRQHLIDSYMADFESSIEDDEFDDFNYYDD